MTYPTLMVHLELGRSNTALLHAALGFAERFDSRVVGIAGCQPMQMFYAEGYVGDIVAEAQKGTDDEIEAAKAEFRAVLSPSIADLEWRSTTAFGPVLDFIADEVRTADLLLTGVPQGDVFDPSHEVNTGQLVLRAGRPVLVVPLAAPALQLRQVLVAWKDSRESRRAIVDALPLLKLAESVTLGTVADQGDLPSARARLGDVARWLARHGVTAKQVASPNMGDDANALWSLAQDIGADLIVAGAYGHSRLREWVLGGVTKNLLLSKDRYSFVSH